MEPGVAYYKEQLEAKEDMLARTTQFLVSTQDKLQQKNKELTETQSNIFESVSFAQIIQNSLQPNPDILKIYFSDASYHVSQQIGIGGDTVFIKSTNNGVFFGLLDATGHGIPAAMLSISGLLILNELSQSLALDSPKSLMELLNFRLYNTFNTARHSLAHFEGTIFHYSSRTNELVYSSANGKALLIDSHGQITSLPVTKCSVGDKLKMNIENNALPIEKGAKLVLFTDGLVDQFGGPTDRKFMTAQLKRILTQGCHLSVADLSKLIYEQYENWKGNNAQTDDLSYLIIQF